MNPWLIAGLALLMAAGIVLADLGENRLSRAGVLAMIGASAGGLAATLGLPSVAWLAGPVAASVVLPTGPGRRPIGFEALVSRVGTAAVLIGAATWAAARVHIGNVPWPLIALPANLAALGLAWTLVPRDDDEARRGAVLALAGGGALLLFLSSPNSLIAFGAGGMAALPSLLRGGHKIGLTRTQRIFLPGLAAVMVVVVAVTLPAVPPLIEAGLSGQVIGGLAIVTVAATLVGAGPGKAASLLGALALIPVAPALRWAGLAGLFVLLVHDDLRLRRLAWSGLTLLATAAMLTSVLPDPEIARAVPVALAAGWVLLAIAVRGPHVRALVLPVAALYLAAAVARLAPAGLQRFQLLAAAGAVLVVLCLAPLTGASRETWRAALTTAMVLLAISTDQPEGILAAVILLVDLIIVQAASGTTARPQWLKDLRTLAASGWPGSAAFAGRSLAVLAAVPVGVVTLAIAAAVFSGFLLMAVFERGAPAATGRMRLSGWVASVLSLVCGLFPAAIGQWVR